MKRIIVSVTNDLVTDNRISRVCDSLADMGFEIHLVGRLRKRSPQIEPRSYNTRRMKLFFEKESLFYAEYNVRLFLLLLFSKFDILLANDLDTLPANYIVSLIRKKPLVYDSHEFFTEVPELIGRRRIRKIWLGIEKKILPKLKYAYTVSESIANALKDRYGTSFRVVRNFPELQAASGASDTCPEESKEKIILYQGALNEGRGLEHAIVAMKYIDDAKLVIAGEGDIEDRLKKLVMDEKLEQKVEFKGRLSPGKLINITRKAHLGISIEEDRGLNYRYALPNKLFDYIHANLPVLVSDLPEMVKIVSEWQIGLITPSHEPNVLAGMIREALLNNKLREEWSENLKKAASVLNWNLEEKKLKEIFMPFLD